MKSFENQLTYEYCEMVFHVVLPIRSLFANNRRVSQPLLTFIRFDTLKYTIRFVNNEKRLFKQKIAPIAKFTIAQLKKSYLIDDDDVRDSDNKQRDE